MRDDDGKLVRAGYYMEIGQQEHIVWKNILEQWGQPQFSEDQRTVLWNSSETGYEAYEFFMNLLIEDKVSEYGFGEGGYHTFYTGLGCMYHAGPQIIGTIRSEAPDLNYGTAPLVSGPAEDPAQANYNVAQYWNYSITSKCAQDPAKFAAAVKFMDFLMTEEAVKHYTEVTGALPPLKSLFDDPQYTEDPYLKAFIDTLGNSKAIFWVDEKAERQLAMDMADRVVLEGLTPREALDWGTVEEQKLRDAYFEE